MSMPVTEVDPAQLGSFSYAEVHPRRISVLKAWAAPLYLTAAYIGILIILVGCWCFHERRRARHTPLPTEDIEMQEVGPRPHHRTAVDPLVQQTILRIVYEVDTTSIPYQEHKCSLCQYEFEDGEEISFIPPCSHVYHSACILECMAITDRCPICREPIGRRGIVSPFGSI